MNHRYLEPEPSEDQRMILDLVAGFAGDELGARAEEIDHGGALPEALGAQLAEMGLLAIPISEEAGGAGFDFTSYALSLAALAHGSAGVAFHVACQTSLFLEPLAVGRSDHPAFVAVATGAALGALAVSEDQGSWDVTASVEDGRLSGTKTWVIGGDRAGWIIVGAREGDGVSLFVIERDRAGVTIGQPHRRLGLRTLDSATVELADVAVGEDDRIGDAGAGGPILASVRQRLDIALAAIGAGIMAAARDVAGRYATERRQFGRAIAEFEAIRERLASSEIGHASAINLVATCARLVDAGADATHLAAIARITASDAAMRATDDALQIYGGYGVSREYPAERLYRDSRCLAVVGGGNDAARQEVAARVLPEE